MSLFVTVQVNVHLVKRASRSEERHAPVLPLLFNQPMQRFQNPFLLFHQFHLHPLLQSLRVQQMLPLQMFTFAGPIIPMQSQDALLKRLVQEDLSVLVP